jgi:hypothetical protein
MFDYLIVGAGFAGSVLAERLASQLGLRVLVCDKRPHVGGNAYDMHDDSGILVHKYGPHIFHTNSARIFAYLSQFTAWRPYEHRVLASVDGKLLPFPINLDTINGLYGLSLTAQGVEEHFARVAEPVEHDRTSEDAVVSKIGRDLYEKFFKNYTRKQWGLDPSELDASVAARVPARATTTTGTSPMTSRRCRCTATPDVREDARPPEHHARCSTPTTARSASTSAFIGDDLHRSHRRVLRLPLRQAAVPVHRVQVRDPRPPRVPVGRCGQLSERARLHPNHGVQVPHRAGAPQDQRRLRVPDRRGRPLLPRAATGERRALPAVQGPRRRHPRRALRRTARHLSVLQHGPGGGPSARVRARREFAPCRSLS